MMSEILNNTSKAAKLEREEEKSGICIAYHEGTHVPLQTCCCTAPCSGPHRLPMIEVTAPRACGGRKYFILLLLISFSSSIICRSTLCATMQYVRPGLAGSLVFKNQDPGPV